MSLSCSTNDDGDYDSWWTLADESGVLNAKRSRKCYSCNEKIAIGDPCRAVFRYRLPDNDIEERIHGDEVPLSTKYLCETCTDLADSLFEQNFCFSLGDESLKQQIADYSILTFS